MVFLSNYLVFKIVLAALGRVDYPVAGDLELKYDTANKIYLSGGSLKYVDDVTLHTTIGGETTSHELGLSSILNKTTTTAYEVALPADSGHSTFGINQDATRYVHQYPVANGYQNGKIQVYSGTPSGGYTTYGSEIQPFNGDEVIYCSMSADGKYIMVTTYNGGNDGYKIYKDNGSSYAYHSAYPFIGSYTSSGYTPAFVPSNNNFVITGTNNNTTWHFKLYVYDSSTETWTAKDQVTPSGSSTADVQRGQWGKGFTYDGSYFFMNCNGVTTRGEVWSVDWTANTMTYKWHTEEGNDGDGAGGAISPDNRYVVLCRHDGNPYRVYENTTGDWSTVVNVTSQFDLTGSGTSTVFGSYGINFSGYSSKNTTPLYIGQFAGLYGDGKFRLENWSKRSLYQIYITDAGKYSVDATIAGLNYKTNEVEVTGSITPVKSFPTTAQKLYPSDGGTVSDSDAYGYVGLSGNGLVMVIVGKGDDDTTADSGGFMVYEKINGVWTYTQQITNVGSGSGTLGDCDEGKSVQLDYTGTRVFIGAHADDNSTTNTGSVYIYKRVAQGNWTLEQTLTGASGSYRYGYNDVNNDGDKLIIGSYGYPGSGNVGRAWYYTRSDTSWSLQDQLDAPSTSAYGTAVSINSTGTRAIIGGYTHSSNKGRADIWNYSGGSWSIGAGFTGENSSDMFGWNVDMSNDGNTVVVGVPQYSGGGEEGRAYIYTTSDGTNWSLTKTLSNQTANEQFGFSVQISGDGNTVVIGAAKNDDGVADGGRSYVYVKSGGSWPSTPTHTIIGTTANSNNGHTLGISDTGETIISGAPSDDDKGTNQGAVYVFDKSTLAELKFDNYNKLSIGNAPTNTSSKLFLGSNVYDIGTLTSDLTIETPGLYRGLVFDTSSNVAYFNKTTVGAIGTTMASYGKQDQVLNAGGDAGYGSGGDASQGGYGNSIDMSADGTRMVVGNAHYTDSNGRVWLYHLENGSWVLKQTWDGGERLGSQVAMNEAGTRAFAIYPGGGVKIWDYSSGAWDTSASGTYTITPGTISYEVPSVDCNKAGDVVIIGSGDSNNTWIYRLSGGSWSSEKNFSRRGSGVAMNGDGTRCFMGNRETHKVWESNYSGGSWGTETEIIDESSVSGYWPASLSTDSAGETVCIKSGDSGDGAIYERAGNGSWSASVSGILSRTEIYGTDKVALSYDGTVAIFGHMQNPNALSTGGHAILYTKSGSTWTLTQTLLNPSSSQHSGDYFGGGTGLAKTAKDRFVVAAMGDDNAGTNYGAIYTYTNAIPDFISFDTYNKLSLSGITNPTSKIHALLTGAETTTVYDIGSATNVYIESEGTYTAEMKGSSAFALDSTVVSGTISFPSRTSYRYLALAFPRNNYENSIRTMTIEFDDGTKFDNANPPASSAFTENYAGNNATTDIFNSSTNTNYSGSSLGWSDGTWYCPFHIDCGSGFTKKVKRVTIINGQSDYQYSLIAPRLYGASSVPSTPGLAANWNYVCHVESIQRGWTLETSSYDMEPKAYRYIGLAGYRTVYSMHIYEFSIELVDGTVYDGSNIPTVSSNMTINSGSAANTIDGDFTTKANWNSASTYTSASQQYVYLKVDLGSAKKVKHIRVWNQYTGTYTNGTNSMNYYGSSTDTSSTDAEGSSDWNRLGPIETLKSNDTTEQTINSSLYDSKLEFDGYNKLSLNKFDPTSTTLKYFSNTYDLGTISNVYIANPGTYSAEIKGVTNFALSSNVVTGYITPNLSLSENIISINKFTTTNASEMFGHADAKNHAFSKDNSIFVTSSDTADGNSGNGKVFIYNRGSDGTYALDTTLTAVYGTTNNFGHSLDINDTGTRLVISEPEISWTNGEGRIHVYDRASTSASWPSTPTTTLNTSTDTGSHKGFGYDLALSGDGNTIGTSTYGGTNYHRAYIFEYSSSSWSETKTWSLSGTTDVGATCDLSHDGTRFVVGSFTASGTKWYSFHKSGSTWAASATEHTLASASRANIRISGNGNMVLVGMETDSSCEIWEYDSSWSRTTTLTETTNFGCSMASNYAGTIFAIGESSHNSSQGRVFIYSKSGSTITLIKTLVNPDAGGSQWFGTTGGLEIDYYGHILAVNAPGYNSSKGKVQLFASPAPPSLDFDTYNKLTLSGLESGSTSNVLFNGNTYSIGTASNVYIENTGTYDAESKGMTTFALTKKQVSSSPSDTPADSATYNLKYTINRHPYLGYTYSRITELSIVNGLGTHTWSKTGSFLNTDGEEYEYMLIGENSSGTTTSASTTVALPYSVTTTVITGTSVASDFTNRIWNGSASTTGVNEQQSCTPVSADSPGTSILEGYVEIQGTYTSAITPSYLLVGFTTGYSASNPGYGGSVKSVEVIVNGKTYFNIVPDQHAPYGIAGTLMKHLTTAANCSLFAIKLPNNIHVPKLKFDDYKLVVSGITPTSSTLKYFSNTYEIDTATNIYVENTGDYTAEIGGAADFAFTSNTVSGTIKTIEPVINGGYFFGHALTYDGKLYGWGENTDGELGVGDESDKTVPTLCTGITQGEVVSIWDQSKRGESRWAKTRDGKIFVTGNHNSYCLPGSSANFTTFTDVSAQFGDYTQPATSVVWASGSERATQVLMENGDVWSFGNDSGAAGILGQGASPTDDRTPRKLQFNPSGADIPESDIIEPSSPTYWIYYDHATSTELNYYLKKTSDNAAISQSQFKYNFVTKTWGDTGTNIPTKFSDTAYDGSNPKTTTSVVNPEYLYAFEGDGTTLIFKIQNPFYSSGGGTSITKIVYNGDLVLALDSSNVVWMWGSNDVGHGSPNWGAYNVPTNIMGTGTANLTGLLVSGETVTDIECGSYSMFVITSKGTVYATGKNGSGQLGQGGTTAKSSSDGWVKIEYFTSNTITVNRLYTGQGNPHVFADTSDGWYCWGENGSGQLGLGDIADKTSPVKFTGVSNIKTFGVGESCHYAIAEDGKYYAWGAGGTNRRGDNDTGAISYPKHIDTLPNILAPSFEFDGYDKIYSNKNYFTKDVKITRVNVSMELGGPAGGSNNAYLELTLDKDTDVRMTGAEVGAGISQWVSFGAGSYATLLIGSDGYIYFDDGVGGLGWGINSRGKWTIGEWIFLTGSGGPGSGNNYTRIKINSQIPVVSSDGDTNIKYTKGTTTYDVGEASIITVPDPGTYDAQLSQGGVFSLKSATVPATSSSGLYTWAFHHGNFDNAYGDGDILTARDNGRFYADTPAYTSTSIGTITSNPNINSYTYTVSFKVINQSGTTTYDGTDGSIQFTMTEGVEYDTRTDLSTALDDAIDTALSGGGYSSHAITILGSSSYQCNHSGSIDSHTYTLGTLDQFHSRSSGSVSVLITNPYYNQTTYTFAPPSGGLTANVLMVAGGGGGGPTSGGSSAGGGAGGLVYTAGTTLSGTKTIVVGNGGANHINGNDTTFTLLTTTVGGGRGATAGETGGNGGSGGGTSHHYPTSPGTGESDQGNAGGNAGNNTYRNGGGGGGAGGVGGNASTSSQLGGVGGIGLNYSSTFGSFYGESGWFAGGGAGCSNQTATPAVGGIGGGGYSSTDVSTADALSGQSHTGGGGGGAGGKGGSGIVLLQTNVATPNVNSEVKIPEPYYHVLIQKPDDTHFSHLPNGKGGGNTHSSGSIVPNIPRADGSVSNVYYATSTGYFYAERAGSLVSSVEGVFYPIEQQRYNNILEIGHNSSHDVELEMASDGTAKLYRNNGGTHLATSTEKCFTAGKWHHIALTLDANRNAVGYVNGYPVVSTTYASAILPGSRTEMCLYRTGVDGTFRKFLMYYFKTYISVLNQNQILKLASSVGLGPKLEYDGLNTIKILNTEPGSSVKLFTSNVADTSNVFIVADPAAGEYTVPESGKYYAEIKGTDTFTVTKTLDVSGTFPLYAYPPIDGTSVSITSATAANSFNNIWTISGAAKGNGQYQVKCNTAADNNHYNAWRNNVGSTNQWQTPADPTYPITFTILIPSPKTIRKYRMFPLDHDNPNGAGTSATPGTSIDPALPGNSSGDATKRPKSWVIRGSNSGNNSDWTDLDTVTNKPISIYGDVYSIDSPASYQYYQVSITANNGGNKLLLGDIQLWGDA